MRVTVEGLITSIEVGEKDGRPHTNILLAQQGEKVQVPVRLSGDKSNLYAPLEIATFTGRLGTWKQRDGIGTMVMAEG